MTKPNGFSRTSTLTPDEIIEKPKQEPIEKPEEEMNLDRIFRYSEFVPNPKKKEPKVIYRAQALSIGRDNRYFDDCNSISPM